MPGPQTNLQLDDYPEIAALAAAILDGTPVDWRTAQSGAVAAYAAEFQIVSEIVALHRGLAEADVDAGTRPADARTMVADSLGSWGPLTLLDRIGEGAFGRVFRAWDSRLEREVALKLLRRSDGTSDRDIAAIEEGRLLARVRHPNVVAVYGAEKIDGQIGLWTEFIHGRTLADVLHAHGPLGAQEATAIGVDICRALSAVHRAGLLHRDIKSQNVMREDGGRIVLLDFGAGRERLEDTIRGGQELTGTPLYLAPELLDGAPATPQSDLYSLAVLIYHLVTGDYPVRGATLDALRLAHRHGRQTWLRDRRPDLPGPFVEVVERALSRNPSDRHESAGAFEAALQKAAMSESTDRAPITSRWSARRQASIAAVLGLTTAAGLGIWGTLARPATAPRSWVLVGQFENRTGDPLFDRTVQYGIESELANSSRIRVVPRPRVDDLLQLMKQPIDRELDPALTREVAIRDGAITAIVLGAIDRANPGYVITARLVTPKSSEVIAAPSERASSAEEMFAAFRRLAAALRRSIGEAPESIPQDPLRSVTTSSLKAFQSYMRAIELGPGEQSLPFARQAVDEDPTFASAWIWMAFIFRNGGRTQEALEAARTAASLVDTVTDWERHWILGSYHYLNRAVPKALSEYQALLDLRPDHFWAVNNLALAADLAGMPDTSRYARTLAELRPNHLPSVVMALTTQLRAGHALGDVEDLWQRGMALVTPELTDSRPNQFAILMLFPAYATFSAGDLPAASRELNISLADPRTGNGAGRESLLRGAGLLHLALGQPVAALRVVEQSNGDARSQLVGAFARYCVGDLDGARRALAGVSINRAGRSVTGGATAVIGEGWMAIWLMTRVGLLDQADASLSKRESFGVADTYGPMAARGDLALARGRTDEAIELLQAAIPHLWPMAGGIYYRASLTLADAWVQKGRLDQAAAALESALTRFVAKDPYWTDAELAATMVRARLVAIFRRLGRTSDAARVERQLQQALAVAEPAFVSRIRDLAETGLPAASR